MKDKATLGQIAMVLSCSVLATAAVVAHGPKSWPVPEKARRVANPVKPTPAGLAAGKKTYVEICAQCHGDEGKGDGIEAMMYTVKPANFTDRQMMNEMTDGEIFYKISEGRRPMPGFKKSLTEEQRWQLVNFVRTFAAASATKPATVDPKKAHKHE